MNKLLPKERIIFDNYNRVFDDWKKEYLEEFEEAVDYSEQTLLDIFYEEERDWWDMEMQMIGDHDIAAKYILFGSVGRWNGVYSGTKIFNSIKEAIQWAIQDCDYIKLYDENGHFCITCSHHDGTNSFELKAITDAGLDYLNRWEDNWNDNRSEAYVNSQIVKKYSRHLNYAHKAYGCPKRAYHPQSKEAFINMINNNARSFYC